MRTSGRIDEVSIGEKLWLVSTCTYRDLSALSPAGCVSPPRGSVPPLHPPPPPPPPPPNIYKKFIKIHEISQLNAYISPGLIMLKYYLGAFMGTLIYALASRGRRHIPLPHPPPWATTAAHYFNFSHVPPPPPH